MSRHLSMRYRISGTRRYFTIKTVVFTFALLKFRIEVRYYLRNFQRGNLGKCCIRETQQRNSTCTAKLFHQTLKDELTPTTSFLYREISRF